MSEPNLLQQFAEMNVNIMNVHEVHPRALQVWVAHNLLDQRVPEFQGGAVPDMQHEVVPKLALFANRLSLTCELFNAVAGELFEAKSTAKAIKKTAPQGNEWEQYKDRLEASKDILYRTWQTISNSYEATSRMMTGIESFNMLQRRGNMY